MPLSGWSIEKSITLPFGCEEAGPGPFSTVDIYEGHLISANPIACQGACVIGAATRSEPLNVHLLYSHFHLQDFFSPGEIDDLFYNNCINYYCLASKAPNRERGTMQNSPQRTMGVRLREARLRREMSQEDVAEALGIHHMTISKYERDHRTPTRRGWQRWRRPWTYPPTGF